MKTTLSKKDEEPTAFIVICYDKNISENESVFQKDVETAAMVIILSTAEKGLGRCMIGIFSPECLFEILDFPKNIKPQLVLAPDKPTDEIITEPVKNGDTD